MEQISAIIPTFNEAHNIADAIHSCEFADEIIVVDSFSRDRTTDIVKSFDHVRLVQHEYVNSATQKNWIIPQATHDWIFLLDADERITTELAKEIKQAVTTTQHVAYWIKRQNYFMDRKLSHIWSSDAVIRLFRKSDCRYQDKHVHAEIETNGSLGYLNNKLIHDTYKGKGLVGHLRKCERYTTWAALDRVNKIKKISMYHLLAKPLFAFLKRYIIQRGIFDGKQGFIIACLGAWNVFIRNVKIWRMHEGEKFDTDSPSQHQ